MSIAGLLDNKARVWVAPPLFASGPTCAFIGDKTVPIWSALVPFVNPVLPSDFPIRLNPCELNGPSTSALFDAKTFVFPAIRLFLRTTGFEADSLAIPPPRPVFPTNVELVTVMML